MCLMLVTFNLRLTLVVRELKQGLKKTSSLASQEDQMDVEARFYLRTFGFPFTCWDSTPANGAASKFF